MHAQLTAAILKSWNDGWLIFVFIYFSCKSVRDRVNVKMYHKCKSMVLPVILFQEEHMLPQAQLQGHSHFSFMFVLQLCAHIPTHTQTLRWVSPTYGTKQLTIIICADFLFLCFTHKLGRPILIFLLSVAVFVCVIFRVMWSCSRYYNRTLFHHSRLTASY